MLYMVCPTCGELLGDKQLIYNTELKKICDKYNINDDLLSRGFDKNSEYIEARQKLIQSIFNNICCRMRAITYVELVKIIKG
jgi:DNA-directed RNA polymerase subunit N (RpoN/RPB10)